MIPAIPNPADTIVLGNLFTEINRLVAQATTTVQIIVGLIGLIAFIVISATGKWRVSAIVMGLFVGGLLIWGAIAGVPYLAEQTGSTIQSAPIAAPALLG